MGGEGASSFAFLLPINPRAPPNPTPLFFCVGFTPAPPNPPEGGEEESVGATGANPPGEAGGEAATGGEAGAEEEEQEGEAEEEKPLLAK